MKNYFNFLKSIEESTKSLFRKKKYLTPEQKENALKRMKARLDRLNKKGGLSAQRSQLEDNIAKLEEASAAWTRKEGKNPEGGLNKKGVASYRRENPGSKLQTAVTTPPSKLKKGSKKAKRRLSFCRRMKGMKRKLTSAKTARDPNSRINKSLRKWNC